jgi:hypothetical protein
MGNCLDRVPNRNIIKTVVLKDKWPTEVNIFNYPVCRYSMEHATYEIKYGKC